MSVNEFEREPVSPERLEPARHFAASYAGEHVAGTEFVIGAMFVAWGVGTSDILLGLLLGNLLAVLSWALVCAPIAVDTRLTLYAYIEKIAGPGMVKLYSLVNGALFCVLAGAMITVSASAVRILFDLPAQVNWYPTSIGFVAVALAVGLVVVFIAVNGFKRVAQFAEICAPWMILMFFAGALALMPLLIEATPGIDAIKSFADFKVVADTYIWVENQSEMGMWHVAAFAWGCNLAMHGGLSDMTILRFARKYQYGYFSALGMFVGHFLAWVCAGVMGAGAALVLKTTVTQLDAGAVAYEALGMAGIIAVIIAGWTTSNPTIYRAGLAFQSINPSWSRIKVTTVTGVVTTIIACFPFVFSKLMDFVSLMGLMLSPLGAILVAEHWLLPKMGKTRYWASYRSLAISHAALWSWILALAAAAVFHQIGLHLFFLLIPAWIVATVSYVVLASKMGANESYDELEAIEQQKTSERKKAEATYLQNLSNTAEVRADNHAGSSSGALWKAVSLLSLLACAVMSVSVYMHWMSLSDFKGAIVIPTLLYFVSATRWVILREKNDEARESKVVTAVSDVS